MASGMVICRSSGKVERQYENRWVDSLVHLLSGSTPMGSWSEAPSNADEADEGEGHVPQGSPRGTYLEVSESLREKLRNGKITEALPSQAALVSEYGVSRSTIERALAALRAEGVIESVQGAGWFVAGTGDRRPLVEKVTDLLRADGVRVGDRFPTEKELCERFGASRTAVRSAIALMEGQGLIGKGAARGREVRALPVERGTQTA